MRARMPDLYRGMALDIIDRIEPLRGLVSRWRASGARIAVVPTMGNLHAAHLRLVDEASALADRVVVTIFVNPVQFVEGEDFSTYPRTLSEDVEKLAATATDSVFAPPVSEMYPRGTQAPTFVEVPRLSYELCGKFRPGHFRGVTTIVCKLFNIIQPDVAVFGEKDLQQLIIIRRMVRELDIPVSIKGMPTMREADGLAMSSRNAYLSPAERGLAANLFRCLCDARRALEAGVRDYREIETLQLTRLREMGFRPEYFAVRRSLDLAVPEARDRALVILTAAWLGKARLLDNLPAVLGDA